MRGGELQGTRPRHVIVGADGASAALALGEVMSQIDMARPYECRSRRCPEDFSVRAVTIPQAAIHHRASRGPPVRTAGLRDGERLRRRLPPTGSATPRAVRPNADRGSRG